MIENDKQYRITSEVAEKFARAILDFDFSPRYNIDPRLIEAEYHALLSQYETLQNEMFEYRTRMKGYRDEDTGSK